jgi:transposase
MGETLRAALNDLAVVAPQWLRQQITAEWFARYSLRVEGARLPSEESQRTAYAEQIGRDGLQLLNAIYHALAPRWLREVPAVEILRRTWMYQYYHDEHGQLHWRPTHDVPPASIRLDSPYDPDAHRGQKGTITWTGYKVHLTETCDDETLHVITHVETTAAPVADITMTTPIHQALEEKHLVPTTHLVDAGYIDSTLLVHGAQAYQIDLVGPVPRNVSWQAKDPQAYDITHFQIDWAQQRVTCPQGKVSIAWRSQQDKSGEPVINVQFASRDCRACEVRSRCTKARSSPRSMTLQPEQEHRILHARRQEQATPAWHQRYDARAGIEGTLSQGIRAFGLRQCRYRGLPKTRLQHLAIAAAINIDRLAAWLDERPHAQTRTSRFAALAA